MEERLQKILAQAGIASRRASEELILAGRVRVNNSVAELGQKADPAKDKITLDGRPIKVEERIYIALHKPRFVLSTVEPEAGDARPTVRDLVPVGERVYPVGRLDFESEGLVLMTNDGDLANLLAHPTHGHEKEYRVLLARQPDGEQLSVWRRGVVMEDGYKTQPADVFIEANAGKGCWVRVTMREGRKRQIREIAALLGIPVVRIVRTRIGVINLGTLKPKEWRYLSDLEVKTLKGMTGPKHGGRAKGTAKRVWRQKDGAHTKENFNPTRSSRDEGKARRRRPSRDEAPPKSRSGRTPPPRDDGLAKSGPSRTRSPRSGVPPKKR